MDKIAIVVLAAGLGKRLKSDIPKTALTVAGKPLVLHVLSSAAKLEPDRIIVVTGHQKEIVEEIVLSKAKEEGCSLDKLAFARQPEQLGTGDALRHALPLLEDFLGVVLVLFGDLPLVRAETLHALLSLHRETRATLSLISFVSSQHNSYGRVVRSAKDQSVVKIVEARDCSPQELGVNEFSSGIFAIESAFLKPGIQSLTRNNAQGEYYLSDLVGKAVHEGQTVAVYNAGNSEEFQGVNDLFELGLIEQALNLRRVKDLILAGVRVQDPASLFVDPGVRVEPGAKIGPQVQLYGATLIEAQAQIDGLCLLRDTRVGKAAHLRLGITAEKTIIEEGATVGPFANLREGTVLGAKSRIGNFVETKKAQVAAGAKAPHLTYLGDCHVGERSNIGAGTITCNYDGYAKHQTVIGKEVFIGSNSALVAPVTIEDGAVIGAGSVITKNVEKDSLAITRAPQFSKPNWAKTRRRRMSEREGR